MAAKQQLAGWGVLVLQTVLLIHISNAEGPSVSKALTVSDVKAAMYEDQKYFGGCYKLLNRTGPVGCAAPSASRVRAPLIRLQDLPSPLTEERAVLVPSQSAATFFTRLQQDAQLQQYVKAVLVYTDALPDSSSAALTFPNGAEYAPYNSSGAPSSYVWNPFGTGMAYTYLPVPAFEITTTLAQDALWRADYNTHNDFKGSTHWLEAELTMQAIQPNSSACLAAGTCWPLGGFNVWSAMPPLPRNTTSGLPLPSGLPITLVVAGIDSTSMFHDTTQAADSPLSGLLAMLAAMELLRNSTLTTNYTRQLVFVALPGEAWGYMGSKRLLWELTQPNSPYTAGINLADIDQVIELGQVGRAAGTTANATTRLYLHSQPAGAGWGDATPVLQAFETTAGISTDLQLNLSRASASNPGVPPSSLFSLLRAKPSVAGVVLQEFDQQFINPYYHSGYDTGKTVRAEPIVTSAILLARTLHLLAAPNGAAPLVVNSDAVLATVAALAQCLVLDKPGMDCSLATSLMNPDYQVTDQYRSYAVKHYLGVLQYVHPDPQSPYYKKSVYRFLWNYMGLLSAVGAQGTECAFTENQCPLGMECIGWKGSNKKNKQLMGRCWNTSVRYQPVLSTKLGIAPNSQGPMGVYFSNASDTWEAQLNWPPDPMWTESNWPETTPLVRVLQRESPATEWAIFGGGIAACLITALLSWWGHKSFEKHLKPH